MWDVTVLLLKKGDDPKKFRSVVQPYHIPDLENAVKQVETDSWDGGKTYTNRNCRAILMIIFRHETKSGFIRTLNHEKRHMIDDILEWHGIKDKEAAGYLDGWVSETLYNHIKKLKDENIN